jgi:hypothetical protein
MPSDAGLRGTAQHVGPPVAFRSGLHCSTCWPTREPERIDTAATTDSGNSGTQGAVRMTSPY